MTDYIKNMLEHPTEFTERVCQVCGRVFKPLYFDNDTCHECLEKEIMGRAIKPKESDAQGL